MILERWRRPEMEKGSAFVVFPEEQRELEEHGNLILRNRKLNVGKTEKDKEELRRELKFSTESGTRLNIEVVAIIFSEEEQDPDRDVRKVVTADIVVKLQR